jgi:hypothetical protein
MLQKDDTFEQFRRIVEAVPFSEVEWKEATAALDGLDDSPVQRAVWLFIACRQSLAGRMDTFAALSRTRTRRGRNEQAAAWRRRTKDGPSRAVCEGWSYEHALSLGLEHTEGGTVTATP